MFKKYLLFLESFGLALFFVGSLLFFLFHLVFAKRIIPGVYLDGIGNLSGLTEGEAREKMLKKFNDFNSRGVLLEFGGQKFQTSLPELGLSFSATASAHKALALARTGNLYLDVLREGKTLIKGALLRPVYRLDPEAWAANLDEIFGQLVGRDARFVWRQGLVIEPEKLGWPSSRPDLEKQLLQAIVSLESEIKLAGVPSLPTVTQADLQKQFTRVEALIENRPRIVYAGRRFDPSPAEVLNLLAVSKTGAIAVLLPEAKELVSKISAKINRPTRTLTFEVRGTTLENFLPGQDGLAVEEAEMVGQLSEEITLGHKKEIGVPVRLSKAAVGPNDLGIKELLAEGTSNFAGSIPGRIRNIKRASRQLNGILIEPGHVFSFDGNIGEISQANGYDYAYIIKEGRTVLGTGGGVCQVSTTVFRAALKAGLPILKRSAHAYRVHYYEQGSSVGLDATVFPPTVDLEFKNDTLSYLLMTTEVEGENLKIRLYGQNDGRQVSFSGPTILSSSPAPAALYQDDPSLPKGVRKQIDFAAPGAVVTFGRKVMRQGEMIADDKFTSNYRPWRAIYLVGTKT